MQKGQNSRVAVIGKGEKVSSPPRGQKMPVSTPPLGGKAPRTKKAVVTFKKASKLPLAEASLVTTEPSSTLSKNYGSEMKSLLKMNGASLDQEGRSIAPKGILTSTGKPKTGTKSKSKKATVQSVLGDMTSDPLRWFREEQQMHTIIPKSLSRNPVKYHVGPYEPKGILEPGDDEKLITIGGYIINMEKSHGINTTIRPKVSSNENGLEIEVRITGCDPKAIRFEKRYNAILVIGVKDISRPNGSTYAEAANAPQSLLHDEEPLREAKMFDEDLLEIVNIFVPRDVTLARVTVSGPDSKGRIFVTAP